MDTISLQQIYDDPKLWLTIPHELHESVWKLAFMLFADWQERLKNVFCMRCMGQEPIHAFTKDSFPKSIRLAGFITDDEGKILQYWGGKDVI